MWEQIRSNRRRSLVLVVVMAALLAALGYAIGEAAGHGLGPLGIAVAAGVWVVMSLVAYFQGDNILLAVSGAQEIAKEDHPQLFNVVEEMQISSGLTKMPRVFIMNDMALNAFATGRDPNRAAVAVTAGLLGRLSRDELQGVVAHEMSHILNRDVLFMTMTGVMLGSIVMISELFLRGLWYSGAGNRRYGRSDRGGGNGAAIMMVVAIVLAILAPVLAQLIYFAVSRRREYLADANAAVLTRYPEGLASALEAISTDDAVLASANKATAPMFIANPFDKASRSAVGLTSTHPPIEERIRVLRSMGGSISFQAYDTAWRGAHGAKRGVMPASAFAGDKPVAARAAGSESPRDRRQQMREAGDLLRKINQFVFLPCTCGLKVKLPPELQQDTVSCPRCGRTLTVPQAAMATAAQASDMLSELGTQASISEDASVRMAESSRSSGRTVVMAAPLRVARPAAQTWATVKCSCGQPIQLSPGLAASALTCPACGRTIRVEDEN